MIELLGRRGVVVVVAAALGLVGACGTGAGPTPPAPTSSAVETTQLTAYLDQQVEVHRFRGAVEIRLGDRVVLSRGYGDADAARKIPNTPDTQFGIGSLTKQFTALAVLKLQEQGKLHTSDLVCRYLPRCPATWSAITIEHLLTHTAGLFNYTDLSPAEGAAYLAKIHTSKPSPEQIISAFSDRPLDFPPGTAWKYSNSGYVVLGYLIEQISGQGYGTFLRQRILDPLGLADTSYLPHPTGPSAISYQDWTTPADTLDPTIGYAAGGLYSTARDLARWNHFLLTGSPPVGSKATIAQLFVPRVDTGQGNHYGYGLRTSGANDKLIYFHGGDSDGFRSYNEIRPANGLSLTVLANLADVGEINALGRTLADYFE